MQHAADQLVLGVDGGQSSTLALVATLDGQIRGAGLAGPSNHITEPGGLARLETALRQSIGLALQAAGAGYEQIAFACLGMTGGAEEARAILKQLTPTTHLEAYIDVVTALAGASVVQPGVVVIAGTGSVAYGRHADGREAKAGGWGYILGDEGSGYDIGRAALRAACQASDGRGVATHLLYSLPAHLGMKSLTELRAAVYASQISRPQIAGLAALVASEARGGDSVARDLLAAAGHDLATAALAVIERLDALETGMHVYTSGGVFGAGSFVLAPFGQMITSRSPRSSVHQAAYSPGVGALLLALRAAGAVLNNDVLRAVHTSLPQSAIAKHQQREST